MVVERSERGLKRDTTLSFARRDSGKSRESIVKIVDVLTEI
jgi:hypothetical protein